MKRVVITILTFNSSEETVTCLESLTKIDRKNIDLEIIVLDNDAKEHPFHLPKALKDMNIHCLVSPENLGFSGGHNFAMKFGQKFNPDYFLILNNDTIVDRNFLQELLLTAEHTRVGAVSPKIYFTAGSEYHKERYTKVERGKVFWYAGGIMDWANVVASHRGVDEVDHGQYDMQEETDIATGCCLLIKKEVIEKVGMYDERYFLYYEDNDLSQRTVKAGFTLIYQPKAVIWHRNAASAGGSGSALQDYYITRNRLLFGMRYAPLRAKVALLRESIQLYFHGRKWQKKGVIDFYMGTFGKGSYANI